MNDERSSEEKLSTLLKDWKVTTTFPAGFEGAVWQRIDAAPGRGAQDRTFFRAVRAWISQSLTRPQWAGGFIALLIVAGVTGGLAQGRRDAAQVQDDLARRYIQALDPYQAGR